MTDTGIKSRVVLITGGAQGIGAAMVREFQARGARVFYCDVDARAGRALRRELGEAVEFQHVDLAKEMEVKRWIAGIGRKAARIDVLINNADLIQPEEIARVALFLAGDGSAAMTGQELLVDRGWAHS